MSLRYYFAGRYNLEMALCLGMKGAIMFVCMQLTVAGFPHTNEQSSQSQDED